MKGQYTLGTLLRSFRGGPVRQLDRVSRELLVWAAGAGPSHGPLIILTLRTGTGGCSVAMKKADLGEPPLLDTGSLASE